MATHGQKAGHLIRAGVLATCLRTWHRLGRTGHAWHQVRRELAELFPESRWNSREAVVRAAQAAAAVGREQLKQPHDWTPERVPDVRRLIRDAFRESR